MGASHSQIHWSLPAVVRNAWGSVNTTPQPHAFKWYRPFSLVLPYAPVAFTVPHES